MDKPKAEEVVVVDSEVGNESTQSTLLADDQNEIEHAGAVMQFCFDLVALILFCFRSIGMAIGVIASIPLLLATLLTTRLVRVNSHGEESDNVYHIRYYVRIWLFVAVTCLLVVMGIFLGIAGRNHSIKHGTLFGESISKWVKIVCMICGFSHLSFVLFMCNYILLDHTKVPAGISEIVDCLVFWWAQHEVFRRLPALKQYKLLGLQIHKWTRVPIFLLIGYNVFTLFTHFIVWSIRTRSVHTKVKSKSIWRYLINNVLPRLYLLYYANGMRPYVSFVLTSLMLSLTWVLYFGNRLDQTIRTKRVITFGNWTFLCLLVFSFLWLLKALVLLSWKAGAIYFRLNLKILEAGKQLYFLGIIGCSDISDIFELRYRGSDNEDPNAIKVWERKTRHKIRETLIYPNGYTPTIYEVQEVAKSFLASSDSLKEMSIPQILENLKTVQNECDNLHENLRLRIVGENENNNEARDEKDRAEDFDELLSYVSFSGGLFSNREFQSWMMSGRGRGRGRATAGRGDGGFGNGDQPLFTDAVMQALQAIMVNLQNNNNGGPNPPPHQFSFSANIARSGALFYDGAVDPMKLAAWIRDMEKQFEPFRVPENEKERSRKNCLLTGSILSNAKEAVDCLNKIISWLLIIGTFFVWLIFTKLATTQLFVLIASPFLAATFIFGETLKTLFQGIIFLYFVHPFDVGDFCVIDAQLMEVKSIGVWKTIFSNVAKVGEQEEVIFPNSELANKVVVNHKTEYDCKICNDYIEFHLDFHDHKKIMQLIRQIVEYLNQEETMFTPGSHSVTMLTSENSLKIAVRFGHKIKLKDSTYFECLKTKDERRTFFILYVQSLVEKLTKASNDEQVQDETRI